MKQKLKMLSVFIVAMLNYFCNAQSGGPNVKIDISGKSNSQIQLTYKLTVTANDTCDYLFFYHSFYNTVSFNKDSDQILIKGRWRTKFPEGDTIKMDLFYFNFGPVGENGNAPDCFDYFIVSKGKKITITYEDIYYRNKVAKELIKNGPVLVCSANFLALVDTPAGIQTKLVRFSSRKQILKELQSRNAVVQFSKLVKLDESFFKKKEIITD